VRWTTFQRLMGAAVAACALAAPAAAASAASGAGFELTSDVAPAGRLATSRGGSFELKGEVRQAPLRIYGGEYSLGVTAGFDAALLEPCACLCWGMGVIFIDGFESGDTSEWSLTVP
jgi:hypothetical protein